MLFNSYSVILKDLPPERQVEIQQILFKAGWEWQSYGVKNPVLDAYALLVDRRTMQYIKEKSTFDLDYKDSYPPVDHTRIQPMDNELYPCHDLFVLHMSKLKAVYPDLEVTYVTRVDDGDTRVLTDGFSIETVSLLTREEFANAVTELFGPKPPVKDEFQSASRGLYAPVVSGDSVTRHTLKSFPPTARFSTRSHISLLGSSAYIPADPAIPEWAIKKLYGIRCDPSSYGTMLSKEVITFLHQLVPDMTTKFLSQWGLPHISAKQNFVYTPNQRSADADRVTQIRPGKWLRQVIPDVTDDVVKKFAAMVLDSTEVHIHAKKMCEDDAAEVIEEVYTSGPSSCMSHSVDSRFGRHTGGIHPITTFAHPKSDVVLVWVTNSRDSIVSRALCRPSQGTYVRIYTGDSAGTNVANVLKDYMKVNYCVSEQDDQCLAGAVIQKLTAPSGAYILPYIDCDNLGVYDDGERFIVADGEDFDYKGYYETGLQEGYDDTEECDECGEYFAEEDMYTTYDGTRVCSACLDYHYRTDVITPEGRHIVHEDQCSHHDQIDEYVHNDTTERDLHYIGIDAVWCDVWDEWIYREDAVETTYDTYIHNSHLGDIYHEAVDDEVYREADVQWSASIEKWVPKHFDDSQMESYGYRLDEDLGDWVEIEEEAA